MRPIKQLSFGTSSAHAALLHRIDNPRRSLTAFACGQLLPTLGQYGHDMAAGGSSSDARRRIPLSLQPGSASVGKVLPAGCRFGTFRLSAPRPTRCWAKSRHNTRLLSLRAAYNSRCSAAWLRCAPSAPRRREQEDGCAPPFSSLCSCVPQVDSRPPQPCLTAGPTSEDARSLPPQPAGLPCRMRR